MKEIEDVLGIENVRYNELMSKHTSFKIGGPADILALVDSSEKLKEVINICKKNNFKITIIGNGSNLLVSDEGIRGVVIKYTANNIEIDESTGNVVCSGGALNAVLAQKLLEACLSGFEFASGIPGTLAGAVCMNAGAFGSEMQMIVSYVKYIDISSNEIKTINNENINFSYRDSIFKNDNFIIIEVGMHFNKDIKENIEAKMKEYKEKRISTQPIENSSAGSTFKRGEDFISAKLIDEAGLKGYTIGGAQVSTKHAGFIINTGNAKAKDVIELINYVKKVVYEKFGKNLETEVRIIE